MLMNDDQKASRLISGFLICVIGLMLLLHWSIP